MRGPVVAAWLKSTIVNAMCGCGQQRALCWACSSACSSRAKSSLKLLPRTPLHNWETELICISTVQPWPPQVWKFCFHSVIIKCVMFCDTIQFGFIAWIILFFHTYLCVSSACCCWCVSSRLISWIYWRKLFIKLPWNEQLILKTAEHIKKKKLSP